MNLKILQHNPSVYPQPPAFATHFRSFTGESPVQVQYTSVQFRSTTPQRPSFEMSSEASRLLLDLQIGSICFSGQRNEKLPPYFSRSL